MSDSNFTYLEAAARRKKKNQIISILIIIAVVLAGVAIWGVREHQRNEAAERVKIALGNQTEPVPPVDTAKPAAAPAETSAAHASTSPAETTAVKVEPVAPAPSKAEAEKPAAPSKPKKAMVKVRKRVEKHVVRSAPVKHHKPVAEKTASAPEEASAQVVPTPPAPVAPPPAAPESPAPAPSSVAPKAFAPVDQPLPAKAPLSEESRVAMNSMPNSMEAAAAPEAGSDSGSENYRQGLAAYRQGDLTNAIRLFSQLPKPETKKRGDPVRDEYVHGNFLRGLALMHTDHTSEAASAFLTVLDYEKFYPLVNMDLGICYVDLKQYARAHQAFEAVVRDQTYIEPSMFDDVMQRTRYFWALAWTRMYHAEQDPDRQVYYKKQAILRWKDYLVWYGSNEKYHAENQKANDYLKSMSL